MEKLREKVLFQNRGKGILLFIIQNNFDIRKVIEIIFLSSKVEFVKFDFKWSKDFFFKSGNLLEINENLLSVIKFFFVLFVGISCGIELWDLGMILGLGSV